MRFWYQKNEGAEGDKTEPHLREERKTPEI